MELNSDLFSFFIDDTFVLKSECVDDTGSIQFDFGSLNMDVIDHLKVEFVDDICGMIFEVTNCNCVFIFPECYLDIIINMELSLECLN